MRGIWIALLVAMVLVIPSASGQENPFQGIFGEENLRLAEEYFQINQKQAVELLAEESPKSSPEDIKAFWNYYTLGTPLPPAQGEIPHEPAADCWAEIVRIIRISRMPERQDEYNKAMKTLRYANLSSLPRALLLHFLAHCYSSQDKERERCEKEYLKAIEAAVCEGRWKGRLCYKWYYTMLEETEECGDRFWGELESRLKPLAADIDPWFWEMTQGKAGIFWGWSSRGTGWGYTVTDEGWDGFGRNLKSSREHFYKALEIQPDWPQPHVPLITVEMGSGSVEDVIRELKAVLRVDPLNAQALSAGIWGMMPRWCGSHELIKMLAMEAINCPRRKTRIPAMGYECLAEIARDREGYDWQNVYLAPDVRQCAETLFHEYESRLGKRRFLASRMYHELAELRYDDAAKTLEELGGEKAFRPSAGWQQGASWRSPIGTPHYDDFGIRIRLFTGKFGAELRSLEKQLLAGERKSAMPEIRALLKKKELPADEQDFLLDWYARWQMGFSARYYNQNPKKRTTAFDVGVKEGCTEVVREMLELGFDWKSHEKYPGDLANTVAAHGGEPAMLEILKEAGDPLDRQEPESGYAPIHHAACVGQPQMVEALLKAGIGIETRSRSGHTPLHLASSFKNVDTMRVLLAHGANVNAQDRDGDTCLIYLPQVQAPPSTYRFLFEQPGINVNLANGLGETPLHLMAKWNTSQDIVEMLLEKGADLNVRTNQGKTPLDVAEDSANSELAKFLRAKGAKYGREMPPIIHPKAKREIALGDWLLDHARLICLPIAVLAIVACLVLRRKNTKA